VTLNRVGLPAPETVLTPGLGNDMDDRVDPTLDQPDEPRQNPPLPKAVKTGAYLGLAVGWVAGLIYVIAAFGPISFEQRDTAAGILIAAPVIGAIIGAVAGWLLRDSEWLPLFTTPDWATFKEVKWGWRTGGIAGIALARSYIANNSPLGFYSGSIALVFELIVPLTAALGGGIGILLTVKPDDTSPPTTSEQP
jgi:hypothetical protein